MKDLLSNDTYVEDIKRVLKRLDLRALDEKDILITGGLGLIGSSVVDVLYIYGLTGKIYVAGRDAAKYIERYGNREGISFLPYNAMEDISFTLDVDYIIHCAGVAAPENYVKKPVETMLSNIIGIANLLDYTRAHNVKRLAYISSSEVYGRKEDEESYSEGKYGVVEFDVLRSSYPIAKQASELLCKSYSAEYGIETVCVRPGHIYGPTASQSDTRVASQFSFLGAKGQPLVLKSSGLQKRSYCYSLDCASAILCALIRGKSGESYNIGNDEIITIRQMAQIIAEVSGVELTAKEPTPDEIQAFNPMNVSSLDNRKIKSIGYCECFSAREAFSHTIQIIRDISLMNHEHE